MKRLSDRSFQRIFYLAASFLFGAVFLRSILVYQDSPELLPVLGMLFVWLIIFASEPVISNKWVGYFPIYLVIQTVLVFILLRIPDSMDFFGNLFAILSMQIMLHLSPKIWVVWIVLCTSIMAMLLAKTYGSEAFALTLIYTAGNVFYGAYSRAIRRAQEVGERNQTLAQELQEGNQKLQDYAAQIERLAVARERNRLARDLHDSVTQTVFSMTLTTQSASLLLERDPVRAEVQLDRLSQLAQNALSEMQLLISELKPEDTGRDNLSAMLRKYLASGHFPENISISLEVQGEQPLRPEEEQGLFHIIQEALNNVVKHAQSARALVQLHLTEPLWIEIEDWGKGFDLHKAQESGRVGLSSMRERAEEIGWDLQIIALPGAGTRVRIEKLPEGER